MVSLPFSMLFPCPGWLPSPSSTRSLFRASYGHGWILGATLMGEGASGLKGRPWSPFPMLQPHMYILRSLVMALITLNSFCRERRKVNNERSVEQNWDRERIVVRIVRGEEKQEQAWKRREHNKKSQIGDELPPHRNIHLDCESLHRWSGKCSLSHG